MASAQDIRDLVSSYVAGNISAADFANRCSPMLRAAIKSHDGAAKALAFAIHAQISHYFHAFISENEFRSNLRPMEASPKQEAVVSFSYHIIKTVDIVPEPCNPRYAAVVDPDLQFV
jgi:hypothetical protein